jgi:hypothetical protein
MYLMTRRLIGAVLGSLQASTPRMSRSPFYAIKWRLCAAR